MSRVDFAVIGCGSMGVRRIRHLKQASVGSVVALDIRSDRRSEVEQQFGIKTLDSVEELLMGRPGAVFICVPPADHLFYLKMAVANRWHFMTEQPVAHSLEGLDELLLAVEREALITHVSCNKRFHPAVQKIREWIAADMIGPVASGIIEIGEWLPDWHPYEPYTDYYPSRRKMGGGLDVICELEWLVHLFGPVSRMACFAGKRSGLDIDTEDVVQVLLEFASGPLIMLHRDMIQRAFAERTKLIGEKGTIEWDWEHRKLRLYQASTKQCQVFTAEDKADGPAMKMKPGWQWVEPMYLADTRSFLDRLQRDDADSSSLREGIENLRLVLQALECDGLKQVWVRC